MLEHAVTLILTFVLLTSATAYAQPIVTAYDDDGMITVNGKRTLIIGSYHVPKSEKPFQELAKAGFNLVNTGALDQMDQAHAAGLMTWTAVGTLDLDKWDASAAELRERVRKVKDHPALAFLESVDEPAWTWMEDGQRVPAQAFVEAYPIIKEIDPNHLLYLNHAPTNLVKTMQAYNPGTDIVAMDIYPVNPGGIKSQFALFEDGHQGDLNNMTISQVGEYVDKMRQVTGPNRPLFMVLQGFAWEMLVEEKWRRDEKILYPSYAETRFMAFQSLIKGANGIIYWGHAYTPQPSQFWSDLKRVTREVADLAEILAQRTAPLELGLDYHETGHSLDDGVQVLCKEFDGKLYLFTCNAYRYPCKATVSGLRGWNAIRALNEDRKESLSLEDGAFMDTWKRFDVHIYELK